MAIFSVLATGEEVRTGGKKKIKGCGNKVWSDGRTEPLAICIWPTRLEKDKRESLVEPDGQGNESDFLEIFFLSLLGGGVAKCV